VFLFGGRGKKPLVRATYSAYCGRSAIRRSVRAWPDPRVSRKVISSGPTMVATSTQDPTLIKNRPHHMQKSPK
jgi:hypothetical protein